MLDRPLSDPPPALRAGTRLGRLPRRLAAAGLTAAVLGAGLAAAPAAAAAPVRTAAPAVATTTPAAQLAVAVNTLLSRDVYQAGIANTVLLTKGNGKAYAYARHERVVTDAALAVLLAPGSTRGQAQFLWAWNRLAYGQTIYALAVNRRAPNAALKAYAVRYIAAAEREVALAVHGLVPALDPTSFAYVLSRTDTLARWATDLLGAGLPLQYLALESAALSAVRLGVPTSAAIAAQRHLTGSVTTTGAQLTLVLALLFQAHVYQTGITASTGFTYGQFTPAYAGATAALDVNSAQATAAVGLLFGLSAAKVFLPLWVSHTRDYAAYQASLIVPDAGLRARSLVALNQFIGAETALLHGLLPALPVATLRLHVLTTHVVGTLQEIDLQAAGSPAQFTTATMGANHFVGCADLLAQAIIASKHFPASAGPQATRILGRAYDAAQAAGK